MILSILLSRLSGRGRERPPTSPFPILPVAIGAVLLLNVAAAAGMLLSLD